MTPEVCKALWEQAYSLEIGLGIEVKPGDKPFLINLLYSTRQSLGKPEWEDIIIIQPGPKPNEIWMVKKATELPDA